jgi:four helix bundle protein
MIHLRMEEDVVKGDELEERLIRFAVQILKICDMLPKTPAGRHLGDQLLRAGAAATPNYLEGRNAESKRDFIHKLRIGLKELSEARIWLRILILAEMSPTSQICETQAECDELCRILAASIHTAQKKPIRDSHKGSHSPLSIYHLLLSVCR